MIRLPEIPLPAATLITPVKRLLLDNRDPYLDNKDPDLSKQIRIFKWWR